jgi:hypothetical protein
MPNGTETVAAQQFLCDPTHSLCWHSSTMMINEKTVNKDLLLLLLLLVVV